MSTESPWGEVTLEEGMKYNQQIGSLYFRIEMENKELWIGYVYHGDAKEKREEAGVNYHEDELEWTRWSFTKPPEKIRLRPYLPDKAMVVHSEYPQRILPGDEARIFVGVPAVVRFEADRNREQSLLELPSETLSRSWFGTREEGELCYWWSTRARRKIPEMSREITRIGCPVWIVNKSDEELYFDKFCHRVIHLHVYRLEGGLWTEETQITYKGNEDLSDVVQGRLPKELRGAEKISPPREEVRRSLAARTFLSFI